EDGTANADFIIIAAPVIKVEEIIEKLMYCDLKQGVIITDVGSTKQDIMKKAAGFHHNHVTFIGGHPIAGSHKIGVIAASAHLFENAYYVLTSNGAGKNEENKLK